MPKLFVVATPIGNLNDLTPRMREALASADLIAAEDTRNSIKLLNHFNIHTPMTSYHEYNKIEKGHYLVEQMLAGKSVTLITDAGTPGISDPGEELVRMCHEAGITVTPIPGPAACINALIISGRSTRRFCFEAFLPQDKKERQAILEELKVETRTIILYEAPHRLIPLTPSVPSKRGPSPRRRAALSMAQTNNSTAPRMGTDAKRNVLKF